MCEADLCVTKLRSSSNMLFMLVLSTLLIPVLFVNVMCMSLARSTHEKITYKKPQTIGYFRTHNIYLLCTSFTKDNGMCNLGSIMPCASYTLNAQHSDRGSCLRDINKCLLFQAPLVIVFL